MSSLYGRLTSPSLCIHTSLRDVHSAMTDDFTTAARITGWFYTSVDDKAVEAIRIIMRGTGVVGGGGGGGGVNRRL